MMIPQVAPASLSERRTMKKTAQPEHSYTGYVPKWLSDVEEQQDPVASRRHTPILGYSGHLRHDEDHIGVTFTKAVEISQRRWPSSAGPLSRASPSGPQDQEADSHLQATARKIGVREPVRRDINDDLAEFGEGDAHNPPPSVRSGYGKFEGASGYGQFAQNAMSAQSGYGAFDGASGYGQFLKTPVNKGAAAAAENMSVRSGYGAFDGASGYGAFQAPPMSARSGYGAFDDASGYGAFMAPPHAKDDPGANEEGPKHLTQSTNRIMMRSTEAELLKRKYASALRTVGGERSVHQLLDAFAISISQRHTKRTEMLQSLKRRFEQHERDNRGNMNKTHLKEALLALACSFTDDQIMALMSLFDPEYLGTVPMDRLLLELSTRL